MGFVITGSIGRCRDVLIVDIECHLINVFHKTMYGTHLRVWKLYFRSVSDGKLHSQEVLLKEALYTEKWCIQCSSHLTDLSWRRFMNRQNHAGQCKHVGLFSITTHFRLVSKSYCLTDISIFIWPFLAPNQIPCSVVFSYLIRDYNMARIPLWWSMPFIFHCTTNLTYLLPVHFVTILCNHLEASYFKTRTRNESISKHWNQSLHVFMFYAQSMNMWMLRFTYSGLHREHRWTLKLCLLYFPRTNDLSKFLNFVIPVYTTQSPCSRKSWENK